MSEVPLYPKRLLNLLQVVRPEVPDEELCGYRHRQRVQGYLAHKKHPPGRTLQ